MRVLTDVGVFGTLLACAVLHAGTLIVRAVCAPTVLDDYASCATVGMAAKCLWLSAGSLVCGFQINTWTAERLSTRMPMPI